MLNRKPNIKRPSITNILMVEFEIIVLLSAAMLGGALGYRDGTQLLDQLRQAITSTIDRQYLDEQLQQGIRDFTAGQVDLARQRFEFILAQAPGEYPEAQDYLDQSILILNATATFTPLPPTATNTPTQTLTPTYDPSGEESILRRAAALMAAEDWSGTIDALLALRNLNLQYKVTQVDDMLFAALRNRGEDKILIQGDLEGGIYDLTLAEAFGPLDYRGKVYRDWARLYLTALGFWQAYPEQAVYYFGQIANIAPGLKDGGGWSARERYRAALIHYGDTLAKEGEWCLAYEQYNLALAQRHDPALVDQVTAAELICYPPTATPEPTAVITATVTTTATPLPSNTPAGLQNTATPTATATHTLQPANTATATKTLLPPTKTHTPVPIPTDTHTPVPVPSDTPVPVPSDTPSP